MRLALPRQLMLSALRLQGEGRAQSISGNFSEAFREYAINRAEEHSLKGAPLPYFTKSWFSVLNKNATSTLTSLLFLS